MLIRGLLVFVLSASGAGWGFWFGTAPSLLGLGGILGLGFAPAAYGSEGWSGAARWSGSAASQTQAARVRAQQIAEQHFTLAAAYGSEGLSDQAITEYQLALAFDPKSSLLHERLAREYLKKGMLSAALEAAQQAVALEAHDLEARLLLAGLYSVAQNYKEALTHYDLVLKQHPRHQEASILKAQIFVEKGDISRAIAFLQTFLKSSPQSALAYYSLGRIHQLQNHFLPAEKAYLKALALNHTTRNPAAALALGSLYEEHEKNAQATQVYAQLLEQGDEGGGIAAQRLATLYLKAENFAAALPLLQAMQARDPEDESVQVKIGLIEMELKHLDQAVQVFQGLLRKNPEADRVHFYLAAVYEEKKQWDQAVGELQKIAPGSKIAEDAILHGALLLRELKRPQDAETWLRRVFQQGEKSTELYLLRAGLAEEGNRRDEAIQVLSEGVQEFPTESRLRYYLGSLYDRQGNWAAGLDQMELILKTNPENIEALNYLGYTWTRQGVRLEDAEKVLKHALSLQPNNGFIQDSWGWYLFVAGRTLEAVAELEKAVQLEPKEAVIQEHLADAYLRANFREKALRHYQLAALLAPEMPQLESLRLKVARLMEAPATGSLPPAKDQPTSDHQTGNRSLASVVEPVTPAAPHQQPQREGQKKAAAQANTPSAGLVPAPSSTHLPSHLDTPER